MRRKALMAVLAVPTAAIAGIAIGAILIVPRLASADPHPRTIQELHHNMCLDSNAGAAPGDGLGQVYVNMCNGGDYQIWTMNKAPGGYFTLVDRATGRCLDSNYAGQVYTNRCNQGKFQSWHPNRAGAGGSHQSRFPSQVGADGSYLGNAQTGLLLAQYPNGYLKMVSSLDSDVAIVWNIS